MIKRQGLHGKKKQKADCLKKQSFVSFEDALAKAEFIGSNHKLELVPYRCSLCNRWHMTTFWNTQNEKS